MAVDLTPGNSAASNLTASNLTASIARRVAGGARDRFLGVELSHAFDPRSLLADRVANGVVASYERPDREFALVAVGEAGRTTVVAGGGPADVREDVARLLRAGADAEIDAAELRPRLLGGFAFDGDREPGPPWDGFGHGTLLLPRLLFVRAGETNGVVVAPGVPAAEAAELVARVAEQAPAPPASQYRSLRILRDVDRGRWRSSVGAIAADVRSGLYEKAVLATSFELGGDGPIAIGAALTRLRQAYPHCHLFSFRAAESTVLGASPELLVGLSGGEVNALGLAGSTGRGEDEAADAQLGRALMESAKNRIEHETVVRAIREGLAPVTSSLRAPNQPQLRRLRNIQHLATEVTGRALPGVDILELLQRLHPTPAVCGWPRDAARKVIAAHEDMDRGWYAGPIGWIDAAGDGEFAVALRCAVVRGTQAWLFAGNGIMGDSDPAAELAEVELKFSPLTEALSGAPL